MREMETLLTERRKVICDIDPSLDCAKLSSGRERCPPVSSLAWGGAACLAQPASSYPLRGKEAGPSRREVGFRAVGLAEKLA